MPDLYVPKDDLDYTLRTWWLLVLFTLAGAVFGWVFSIINPPLFEAQAEITISIDVSRTGTLTGESQDMLIDAAGDVIGAPEVMAALEIELDPPDVQAFYLERKADRFALRVVGRDREKILQAAERWSSLAISALDEAARHVFTADILERYLASLTSCVQSLPSAGSGTEICDLPSLDEVQRTIQDVGVQLREERAASRSLVPGVRYWLSQTARLTGQPVQYARKALLLGGALIGFILGLWLLHLRLPEQKFRRKRGG